MYNEGNTMETSIGKIKPAALVTGAAKNLGKEIALELARNGFDVIVHYRTSRKEAEETAEMIRNLGRKAHVIKADLTRPEEVRELFRQTIELFGKLDVLVNNVGDFIYKPALEITEEEWSGTMDSCLNCTYYCCRNAIQVMEKQGHGRIINLGQSGLNELKERPFTLPYFVSKTGIYMMTKTLAKQVQEKGIRINMVSPGVLPSSLVKPQGAKVVEFKEITAAILFLLREDSSAINGANLEVGNCFWP